MPTTSLRVRLACGCDVVLRGADADAVREDHDGFASARCPRHSHHPLDYWTVDP